MALDHHREKQESKLPQSGANYLPRISYTNELLEALKACDTDHLGQAQDCKKRVVSVSMCPQVSFFIYLLLLSLVIGVLSIVIQFAIFMMRLWLFVFLFYLFSFYLFILIYSIYCLYLFISILRHSGSKQTGKQKDSDINAIAFHATLRHAINIFVGRCVEARDCERVAINICAGGMS